MYPQNVVITKNTNKLDKLERTIDFTNEIENNNKLRFFFRYIINKK